MGQVDGEEVPLGVGVQLTYRPALDGIRAVSILGIMANHGGFGWAAGGVISVNVFFVLSGFLITMLLMKEWSGTGTIRLGAFWARRARRLLPALFVLLAGIALYALLFAPSGTLPALRRDGLSTLLYVSNWHQIASGQSYFARVASPSPLLHTWTLAIEEQFYIFWPLLVLGCLKLFRSPRVLLGLAVAGILASAVEAFVLFHPGVDPSRLYYGTDTRAQDILTGAALGILLSRPMWRRHRPDRPERAGWWTRVTPRGWSWVAVVGAGGFALEWLRLNRTADLTYRGGFLFADVMVALVILGVTRAPHGLPARVLGFGPLTFVGRISYGLYLWHWPVFLVLDRARTGLGGLALFALRFAVAFVIAVASWYLVETPVRQMRFFRRRSWAWGPIGAVAAAGMLVAATAGSVTAGANEFPTPAALRQDLTTYSSGSFPADSSRTRVLVVGDSLSLTVGYWMSIEGAAYGVVLRGRPLDGCGLATAVPFDLHGVPNYPLAPCADWPTRWGDDVRTMHPQVVALVIGWWETMDRQYDGTWQHLGDPAFDAYELARLRQAVAVLGSGGAHVALMTSPYYDSGEQLNGQPWDEDSPARVDLLNRMIAEVAAEHPGTVSVVPLGRYLDPDGHYTSTIDGRTVRFSDGVHTTAAAGPYLAGLILPALARMAP